jgi:hypothetical protein
MIALQKMIGNAAVSDLLSRAGAERPDAAEHQAALVQRVLRSPGRPLADPVRAGMEAALGADFSDVRVHTGQAAHESAAAVAAQAYTSGTHIVFERGRYDTTSGAGREVLAHELTHVVQQRSGPVAGTATGGGLAISDPADRFEREAERGAAGVTAAAQAAATAAPGAGPGLPVARLMSVEGFQKSTQVRLHQKRGSSIKAVEEALTAYHALPPNQYVRRRNQLGEVTKAIDKYRAESKSPERHEAVLTTLDQEVAAEKAQVRMPAIIEEIGQQTNHHAAIYQQLADAQAEPDEEVKATLLLAAQEALLTQLAATQGPDTDLQNAAANLGNWLNNVINGLPEDARRRLVESDLRLLRDIQRDPQAPQVTRDTLDDLLAHQQIVKFGTGSPGTRLSAPGSAEKYSMTHAMNQPGGATERLGSLAHELTHVDAGESYANTAILLLMRPGLSDPDIKSLVADRKARIGQLRALLGSSPALNPGQKQLVGGKLHYAEDPGKGVGRYAVQFHASRKIDDPTFHRLKQIEDLAKPDSSVLVEYDTVITQILVYLHQWQVDQQDPLYVAVMNLAGQLRRDRAAARSAGAAPVPAASGQGGSASAPAPVP